MKTWKLLRLIVWCLILVTTDVSAGPPADWISAEDGITILNTLYEPIMFEFDSDIYLVAEDGLYVQLYNQPCIGWKKVYTPAPASAFRPIGDYLFAFNTNMELWWIEQGVGFSSENWKKVSLATQTKYVSCIPMTSYNGYLYACFPYHTGENVECDKTFDIFRSADIGKTTMVWGKVVEKGFGDYQNHDLGFMGEFKGKLMAITTQTHDEAFGVTEAYLDGIEVWESTTGSLGSWVQVNDDGFGTEMVDHLSGSIIRTNCVLGAAVEYNSCLYVGTKSHLGAEIWRYDGTGLTGWTSVTPDHLGVDPLLGGPGRVSDMSVYDGKLYVAESYPTANLSVYDGSSWNILISAPPFDSINAGLTQLAVLPSRSTSSGVTGDMLFVTTFIRPPDGGGYQIWGYPFTKQPLTCTQLDQATIEVNPVSAINELGPGQTHTVIATVDIGGVDISDVWINFGYKIDHQYSTQSALGFLLQDCEFTISYPAVQGPEGLWTDVIEACFTKSETSECAYADKTWVDTTPPEITITVPGDGASYVLNDVVNADFTVEDAVGVDTKTSTVPNGGPIPTDQGGDKTFSVTAIDFGGNQTAKSVTYHVLHPPVADAGPDKSTMVGLTVTLDGSGSTDADGSIVKYEWDVGDGAPCAAGVTCSTVYDTAGAKTVTLTVTDNDGLTASDTATMTVKTPAQGVGDLGSEIDQADLPEDIDSGLMDKLDAALKAVDKGNYRAASNLLNAFINMVNSQRGKTLTDAQADALIQMAQDIMDSINTL